MITADAIRQNLRAKPFRPFYLKTAEGEILPVPTADSMMVMKNRFFHADPSSNRDTMSMMDVDRLDAMEFFPPGTPDVFASSESLSELLRERPFEPFRLHLSSGAFRDVDFPESAWVLATKVLLGAPGTDEYETISIADISFVEKAAA